MSPNLLINKQIRPPIEILKLIIHLIFPYSEVSPPWVKILAPPMSLYGPSNPQGPEFVPDVNNSMQQARFRAHT